ncbi:hypothetical protein [Vibrio sp. LaRot3]|uniref:hypothetical protein n=1 Tax=Vibrio sp. LaRot3 TaxID=2998829 RepID=UPI0022CDDED4|nr:hypothetical protein [Vibrio sp. LaRot3]MDA0148838.1 hypothetical protein [Vibrio sp. LaRot3]
MGKNWEWSYQRGIERRLEAEQCAQSTGTSSPSKPPLHSHDATMQSYFERGWHSVTPAQVYQHLQGIQSMPLSPLDQIRRLKQCHFQPSQG